MAKLFTKLSVAISIGLSACQGMVMNTPAPPVSTPTKVPAPAVFEWPASVRAFGDGYPNAGDSCRRLGESLITNDFLDHTETLIGCPGHAESQLVISILEATGGNIVHQVDGVTLISISDENKGH